MDAVDASLCGVTAVLQAVVADPVALGGLAFTGGIVASFGPASGGALYGAALDQALGGGVGDGTFFAVAHQGLAGPPVASLARDLNGDDLLDVAVVSSNEQCPFSMGTVAVLLGQVDWSFATPVVYDTGFQPTSMAVADLDLDGALDLLVGIGTPDAVWVHRGIGDGTFARPLSTTFVGGPLAIVAEDLNRDDLPDVAVLTGSGEIRVLQGQGDGSFVELTKFPAGAVGRVSVGDLDQDGQPDLALADRYSSNASVQLNRLLD